MVLEVPLMAVVVFLLSIQEFINSLGQGRMSLWTYLGLFLDDPRET